MLENQIWVCVCLDIVKLPHTHIWFFLEKLQSSIIIIITHHLLLRYLWIKLMCSDHPTSIQFIFFRWLMMNHSKKGNFFPLMIWIQFKSSKLVCVCVDLNFYFNFFSFWANALWTCFFLLHSLFFWSTNEWLSMKLCVHRVTIITIQKFASTYYIMMMIMTIILLLLLYSFMSQWFYLTMSFCDKRHIIYIWRSVLFMVHLQNFDILNLLPFFALIMILSLTIIIIIVIIVN